MKKLLCMMLTLVTVLACISVSFVSAGAEPADDDTPELKNVALGKSYTGADPSTRDGASQYNAKLTDGVAYDRLSYDGNWFAFYYNADAIGAGNINAPDRVGTVVIDLEQVYSVSKVRLHAFLGNASGILTPSSVKAEVSADGSSYTQLGSTKNFDNPAENDMTVGWVDFSGSAECRYVRVTVALNASPFAFINEIEVLGKDVAEESSVPSEESSVPSEESSAPSGSQSSAPSGGSISTGGESSGEPEETDDDTPTAESTSVSATAPTESGDGNGLSGIGFFLLTAIAAIVIIAAAGICVLKRRKN